MILREDLLDFPDPVPLPKDKTFPDLAFFPCDRLVMLSLFALTFLNEEIGSNYIFGKISILVLEIFLN
jgi:hypothetical protein